MNQKLLLEIKKHTKLPFTLIGIDGPGGVGKTTLSEKLSREFLEAQIVHMDDFDVFKEMKMNPSSSNRPVGPDTEWKRVLNDVILPLKSGKNATFRSFDRGKNAYTKRIVIKPKGIIFIEGVFAIRRELFSHYDFTIWVECSLKTRVKRVFVRDGEEMRDLWEKDWLPMEEKYMQVYSPKSYVHYMLETE